MDITSEVNALIGHAEDEGLEYKAVLPPARAIAQVMCGFANCQGGVIILGIAERDGKIEVNGLSEEFDATVIIRRAIDLLSPKPTVYFQYIFHSGKRLYAIKVEKSAAAVAFEGKVYVRQGSRTVLKTPIPEKPTASSYIRIKEMAAQLNKYKAQSTAAKETFIGHYLSVLNILNDLSALIYPQSPQTPTTSHEGKILMRILFSSCADNFETYMADLLYEIYLAKPVTLKSAEQITVKEVLDCGDMQEFIDYYAKKKLAKLQRGSVKGFIADNQQISGLGVFDTARQDGVEKLLQIRHLYSHRNGRVDEKFLRYYPGFKPNDEHQMALDDFIEKCAYLAETVDAVDRSALAKFQLASVG